MVRVGVRIADWRQSCIVRSAGDNRRWLRAHDPAQLYQLEH
jgi:hypothetical protein